MSFKREVETSINRDFEYVGSDTQVATGDEVMMFRGKDGKTYGVIVFEMAG